MTTIFCAGAIPDQVHHRLSTLGSVIVDDVTTEAELKAATSIATVIVARANVHVTRGVIEASPSLRVIARSGTGTDNVDLVAASDHDIPVVVTPEAGTNAVAEGAVALMCALGKRLTQLSALTSAGRWTERDAVTILDISGASVGIFGLGRIGTRVAQLMNGLGAHVTFYDPFVARTDVDAQRAESISELFASNEFISMHVPLTEATQGIVDRPLLLSCIPGSVFVNASRGGLIRSLDDVVDALDAGTLGGVGLDVYTHEPPDHTHRIFSDSRVVTTPHMLALSRQGRMRIYEDMCTGIEAVLDGKHAPHVANPEIYE